MNSRVRIRPQALRDLTEQGAYLAENAGLETALRFYEAAEETFRLLAAHPEMGRAREFRNPRLAGVRMCLIKGFGKHLIFSRRTKDGVEIVRVMHGARDIEKLFDG